MHCRSSTCQAVSQAENYCEREGGERSPVPRRTRVPGVGLRSVLGTANNFSAMWPVCVCLVSRRRQLTTGLCTGPCMQSTCHLHQPPYLTLYNSADVLSLVVAARVWNSLPDLVTSAPSVVFRSRLKTHLFNISYPSPFMTVQCPRSDA